MLGKVSPSTLIYGFGTWLKTFVNLIRGEGGAKWVLKKAIRHGIYLSGSFVVPKYSLERALLNSSDRANPPQKVMLSKCLRLKFD